MADITEDISNINSRLSALEQEQADSEQTITRIIKLYPKVGVKVTFSFRLHQYRLCGDTNPLYPAIIGTDTYI